jgi:hypothetical protein
MLAGCRIRQRAAVFEVLGETIQVTESLRSCRAGGRTLQRDKGSRGIGGNDE